jgi:hypothetical protein
MVAKFKLSAAQIASAIGRHPWDLCNDTLYALCRKNPLHRTDEEITAKITIIGRVYAASLERRKETDSERGDAFVSETVVPRIRDSKIDDWFKELAREQIDVKHSQVERLSIALKTHANLVELFERIAKQQKRSLASKYLHFHFPDAFYIFDSRAIGAVKSCLDKQLRITADDKRYDQQYSKFVRGCEELNRNIENVFGRRLSPREIDKVLLKLSADTSR